MDSFHLGVRAAKHILESGDANAGFFGLDRQWLSNQKRFAGFKETLSGTECELHADNIFWMPGHLWGSPYISYLQHPDTYRIAHDVAARLISGDIKGLFCASAGATHGIVRALIELGAPTDEVSRVVVGCVDTPITPRIGSIQISYIVIPHYEIGLQAARIIALGGVGPSSVLVESEFVPSQEVDTFFTRRRY
jgi:DNA-binding LacI/PurR family transcriptional regulator